MPNAAQVARNLERVLVHLSNQAGAALMQVAEEEMGESKQRTPVDTGALRDSGFVEPPVFDPTGVSVRLGFGGPAIDYAVAVHENLESHHDVGQAKFLESVLLESAPFLAQRIAARMNLGGVL